MKSRYGPMESRYGPMESRYGPMELRCGPMESRAAGRVAFGPRRSRPWTIGSPSGLRRSRSLPGHPVFPAPASK